MVIKQRLVYLAARLIDEICYLKNSNVVDQTFETYLWGVVKLVSHDFGEIVREDGFWVGIRQNELEEIG